MSVCQGLGTATLRLQGRMRIHSRGSPMGGASKPPGEPFKIQIARSLPQSLWFSRFRVGLTICISKLIQMVLGPYLENHSVQLRQTLCDPMDCSMPGFPALHQHLEPAQTHVHLVGDAIQPSYPLSFPSPPAFNLSQNHGLFQWVSSLQQVAKILECQLQHQSLQWIFRTDFL